MANETEFQSKLLQEVADISATLSAIAGTLQKIAAAGAKKPVLQRPKGGRVLGQSRRD